MKLPAFGSVFLILVSLVILLLLTISGCLYQKNRQYLNRNRELIIQNDSIISVNIELKHALDLSVGLSNANGNYSKSPKHQ